LRSWTPLQSPYLRLELPHCENTILILAFTEDLREMAHSTLPSTPLMGLDLGVTLDL
jgi:hypothetical protein